MSEAAAEKKAGDPMIIGRYALFDELAAGGMATVHLARLLSNEGPGRNVAVKRLHSQYTKDNEFCTMFMDEARLVTRIKHPNCVRTVDVVQTDEGLFLVMEYVHGESLSRLMRTSRERKEPIPPKLVATLVHNALLGLHAAHEVTGEDGKPLNVVHRDVSPQNIIVGIDGAAKVLDFGIAKAAGRMQQTREGQIKGKLAYMAPEQIRGQVDRRTDVFAAAVCLWEALAGRRMHEGMKDVEIVTRVVQGKFLPPSTYASGVSHELDQIVLKGLASDPKKRYLTAKDMASDIESKVGLMDRSTIGKWVERLAKPTLDKRAAKVAAMEAASAKLRPSSSAMRMPALSTPDMAFAPVSTIESTESRSEKDVQAELDAVAPTVTPPAYTPDPEVSAAANSPNLKPPPPPSARGLKTATPVLPISPVKTAVARPVDVDTTQKSAAPLAPSQIKPQPTPKPTSLPRAQLKPEPTPKPRVIPQVVPPVGAPVPTVPDATASPNDTGPTQHTQLTPSGTEVPLIAVATEEPPAPPRRSPMLYVGIAACLIVALAGAALGGYALARRAPPPEPTPKVTPTSPNPNVTTPPIPSPTTDLAPSASPSTSAAPATSATASASASASASAVTDLDVSPSASSSAASDAPKKPRPITKPSADKCDPPFVLDENGNKKFKPECMGF